MPRLTRGRVESALALDVSWLNRACRKADVWASGAAFTLEWTRDGLPAQSVFVEVREREVRITWTVDASGCALAGECLVRLASSRQRLAGERRWWRCPACAARVGVLYFREASFQCRSCAGLAYTSQLEARPLRLFRRAWKLRTRIAEAARGLRPRLSHQSMAAVLLEIARLELEGAETLRPKKQPCKRPLPSAGGEADGDG